MIKLPVYPLGYLVPYRDELGAITKREWVPNGKYWSYYVDGYTYVTALEIMNLVKKYGDFGAL